jgi:DNA-binding SARP family transcriptional activator
MEFRVLGPLEVRDGDRLLSLGGTKQRALLAVLLLHANEVVSNERLIDALWGDHPPPTAANTLQVHVSKLRKLLESDGSSVRIVTRPHGYMLQLDPDELDLHRFERLLDTARDALAANEPETAAGALREAIALWRGDALADLAAESFGQAATLRLEDLRLTAVEELVEAELALGRHRELVSELRALTAEHPFRERLPGQLMLALYRSGRQAEALEVYQATRRLLVEELGIEPGQPLQRLERAILVQDPALDAPRSDETRDGDEAEDVRARVPAEEVRASEGKPLGAGPPRAERSILLAARDVHALDILVDLAAPLAGPRSRHEIILTRILVRSAGDPDGSGHEDLAAATSELHERREALAGKDVPARVAAFISSDPGEDIVRLTADQEVDLLLVEASGLLIEGDSGHMGLDVVLERAPCDVGLVIAREGGVPPGVSGSPVLVTFAGGEHDWAALELGAWIARARDAPLTLLGPAGDPAAGRRDSSRLLATASLVVQQFAGIAAQPLLIGSGAAGIIEASERGSLLIVGLSAAWKLQGLAPFHATIAREARVPTVFVRRGLRPGGLAPRADVTRFTWSLAAQAA